MSSTTTWYILCCRTRPAAQCSVSCPPSTVFARGPLAVLSTLGGRKHVRSDDVEPRSDGTRCLSLPGCCEAPAARRSPAQPESAPSEQSIRCCAPAPRRIRFGISWPYAATVGGRGGGHGAPRDADAKEKVVLRFVVVTKTPALYLLPYR